MLRYFRILLLLVLVVASLIGHAQELIFENISNRLSLPSPECYNIMQDHNGYIWVGCEQGLVRYDGKVSKIFTKQAGISEKAVYAAVEDTRDRLWIATSKNRVMRYEHGIFKEIAGTKSYLSQVADSYHKTFGLVPFQDYIYVNSSRKLFIADINTEKMTPVNSKLKDKILFLKDHGRLVFMNWNDVFYSKFVTVAIKDRDSIVHFRLNLKTASVSHWRVLTAQIGSDNFFSFNNRLIRVRPDFSHEVYELPSAIISLYADKHGGLWVGTIKKGVFYFPDPNKLAEPIISLNNLSVSGICEDREQNIWCATLEDGVFFSKSRFVRQYTNLPELAMPINMLKHVSEKLFLSPFSGGLLRFDGHHFESPLKGPKTQIYNIFSRNSNSYFIAKSESAVIVDSGFKKISSPKWLYTDQLMPYFTIFGSNTVAKKQVTYIVSYDKVFKVSPKGIELFSRIRSTGKSIEYMDNNNLFIGCANGLYRLYIPTRTLFKITNIHQTVTKIYRSRDKIWICTKGDGLYLFEKGTIRRIDRKLSITTDIFYDIVEDSSGTAWVGTNKGLLAIRQIKGEYVAEVYSTMHGMPSNEINKVELYGGQVFFSSPRGLASIPWAISLKNITAPLLLLDKIEVNDKPVSRQEFIKTKQFPPQQNNLKFDFSVFSYKNDGHRLFYRIQPGKKYMPVEGSIISLENLKPDDYELNAYAVNSDGTKSNTRVVLNFSIDKPFWQKAWFFVLVVMVVSALVYLLRKILVDKTRRREVEKTRISNLIAQSKLAALQARMNPHFIFNAINSIQNYISNNQRVEAQDYLVKFSRLIRLVLQQSAEKFLSLQEELDTLRLYIELEKLRFKTAFDYQIKIAEDVEAQAINIPTMFIQPYVENAIWHGLMNLGQRRQGNLMIDIVQRNNELVIVVEDNGVGRKEASSHKKEKNYVSAGMMLTEERLDTLQQIFSSDSFGVKITDLYDENELAVGTRVEIAISLLYDYTNQYD